MYIFWAALLIPPSIGAVILIVAGIVPIADLYRILHMVSGPAVTILSTLVMSIVLESIGLFRWAAYNIVKQAKGSGVRLFWYVVLLCFLMTMFFNNIGSILITTPIILQMTAIVNLKMHQKLPYLVTGALVAAASSAPIGISGLTGLIALNIVGLDINSYVNLMFVPSMIGIAGISLLLQLYYIKDIPAKIAGFSAMPAAAPSNVRIPRGYYSLELVERWGMRRELGKSTNDHPLRETGNINEDKADWRLFRAGFFVVILIRAGFFAGAAAGIPIEWMAIAGAIVLIALRWMRAHKDPADLLKKTPWHLVMFAFGICVVAYALYNTGITVMVSSHMKDMLSASDFYEVLGYGLIATILSNLLSNVPAIMIGTLALSDMGLDPHTLQLAYSANILGSDIGSLLTPLGTLAILIWMYQLKRSKIDFSWSQYLKVAAAVIPLGLLVSLASLYLWVQIIK